MTATITDWNVEAERWRRGWSVLETPGLISVLLRRLGRLVRLKRTLERAAPRTEQRINLVHAATRSTLGDLSRLGQADLALVILSRGLRGWSRRGADRGSRRIADGDALDERARR